MEDWGGGTHSSPTAFGLGISAPPPPTPNFRVLFGAGRGHKNILSPATRIQEIYLFRVLMASSGGTCPQAPWVRHCFASGKAMKLSCFWSLFSLICSSRISAQFIGVNFLVKHLCVGLWVASICGLILSRSMLSSSWDKIGRRVIPL